MKDQGKNSDLNPYMNSAPSFQPPCISAHWEQLFNKMNICLWSVDASTRRTLQISSSCKTILGYDHDEFMKNASLWEDILHPNDKENVLEQLLSIQYGQSAKLEYRIRTPYGDCKWVSDYVTAVYERTAKAYVSVRYDRVVMDIDHRKKTEEELNYLSFHDALTGLPNRRKLEKELQNALIEAAKHKRFVGILFIDIDRFKDIND
ncbi:PAS domain S-box-containing protein [Neobacillus cucumis]|nr:PAS domain S-box-containing protein [Neobacillus cucumis]